jgi:UDP-glucuronate decarboxylase
MRLKFFSKGQHVFITGGTGFFGKSLLRFFLSQHRLGEDLPNIDILTRDPKKFLGSNPEFGNLSWLKLIKGDILSPIKSENWSNYTHIIHAAANSSNGPSLKPVERFNLIVDGTKNILEFSIKCNVKKILFISSGAVYGKIPDGAHKFSEKLNCSVDTLNPNNAYSVGKIAAENLCKIYQNEFGINIVIARCFSFVGEDLPMDKHYAIGNLIYDAIFNKEITVTGSGLEIRSYLYQSDLAVWLLTILMKGKPGSVYNVGSNEVISIYELAKIIKARINPEKDIRILGKRITKNEARNVYVPDVSKAKNDLGLELNISLSKAIDKVYSSIIINNK